MATFEIDIQTQSDVATVYVDDLSEFIETMNVSIVRTSRRIVGLPVLAGYRGPIATGRFESGEPVLRYEEDSTGAAIDAANVVPIDVNSHIASWAISGSFKHLRRNKTVVRSSE
jgi:hypothetical protein